MKKALQAHKRPFLYEKGGQVLPEEMCTEEVIAALNRWVLGEWDDSHPLSRVLGLVYGWVTRYLAEGATEAFLNDLNAQLHQVQYFNYVAPADLFCEGAVEPESIFVVNMNLDYTPEAFAAKEFARFINAGMLQRIRRCQYPGCGSIFLGPPQAKWCSKTCGSKYRVGKKRKRDSQ